MARTDFAKLFGLLPAAARTILEADEKHELNSFYAPTNMGVLKDRTEQVGPDNARREAGIFEFHASQVTKLPLGRWKEFAIKAHDHITRLHGG
jgi:hypothetical protein